MAILYFWGPINWQTCTKRYLLPFSNTCHALISLSMQIGTCNPVWWILCLYLETVISPWMNHNSFDGHSLVIHGRNVPFHANQAFFTSITFVHLATLRKHAYSNILRILPPKNENFQMKNSDIFLISAQNIDCRYSLEPPRCGGSNEYLNLCLWAEIRKIMYTPCKPQFYYTKVGFKGVKSI